VTDSTTELFGPVAGDLAAIDRMLRWEIDFDPKQVGAPMADLFDAGGKRIRPALVLLAARFGKYDLARLTPAAMAVELTHNATLVHDDVIDQSALRRGRPTVVAKLGGEPAIVIGDYYFAKAYELASRTGSAEVVAILARAVMRICDGEVRQQSIRYRYSTDIDEYLARIAAKTAVLLGACCEIGALLAGVKDHERLALLSYGQFLGVAFQIADDVLDYTGSEGEVGKTLGHDIAEGFATLPLMLASIHLEDDRRLNEDEARAVVDQVRSSEGPRLALAQARDHANRALAQLEKLGESETTSTLASLADYVVSRKL
jgi:heptaprenyl diphosphate synthase